VNESWMRVRVTTKAQPLETMLESKDEG